MLAICASSSRSRKPAIYGLAAEAEIRRLRPLSNVGNMEVRFSRHMPFCMCPLMDGVLLSSCLRERWSAVSNFLVNLTCGQHEHAVDFGRLKLGQRHAWWPHKPSESF